MSYVPMLSTVNARIQQFLSASADGLGGANSVSLDELRAIQHCLTQVEPELPNIRAQRVSDPEAALYFENLKQLLPRLQAAAEILTAQRDELDQRRNLVHRARAWADSYRECCR